MSGGAGGLIPEVRKIESQRRSRMAFQALLLLILAITFSFKVGPLYGAMLVLILLLVLYGTLYGILGWAAHQETARRKAGAAPSWPAAIPRSVLREEPGAADHSASDDHSAVAGRLTYLGPGLSWKPTNRSTRSHPGAPEMFWDHSWSADVHPLWGTGRQGRLTLTGPHGRVVQMWVRFPKDLRSMIRSAKPTH